jgi:hypothetical protein
LDHVDASVDTLNVSEMLTPGFSLVVGGMTSVFKVVFIVHVLSRNFSS